jgi:hypothetical protein
VNRTSQLVSGALVAVTISTAAVALGAVGNRHSLRCPDGYFPRKVRIEHQRLENDPLRGPVVTPNAWPEDNDGRLDRRYLVALVCVRPLTDTERNTEPYTDGDTTP